VRTNGDNSARRDDGRLQVEGAGPLPERLATGKGTALFVDGHCSHPEAPIRQLSILIDGSEQEALGWAMPTPGTTAATGSYWWGILTVPGVERTRTTTLRLRAQLKGGGVAEGELGLIELAPRLEPPALEPPRPPEDAEGPLVAVAMATYEPPIDLFRRQVESIRGQGHHNWVCVISDDASSAEAIEGMREVIGDDPRFGLSVAEVRNGVYGNFERALTMVPADVAYVTLCDQDDRWREDKLEKLLAAFRPGVVLVYSDTRVVDREGSVSSETYWTMRRNNHTNFASLFLANTVTGAASMLDRGLLDDVLPFPPRQGNAYHDHWIAQMALAVGEIAYVDEPLYDYVQHGGASLGHLSANAFGRYRRRLPARIRSLAVRLRQQGLSQGWRLYFDLYCRVRLAATVVEMRGGDRIDRPKRRILRRIADRPRGIAWLAARSARAWWGANETLGREQAMLAGLAWRRAVRLRRAFARGRSENGPAARARGTGGGQDGGEWLTPLLVDYFTRDGSTVMMRLLSTSPQVAVEEIYPYEQKYFAYLWRWSQTIDRARWPEEQWGPRSLGSLGQFRDAALIGPPPWHPRALIESRAGEPAMAERAFELLWEEFSTRAARRTRERHGSKGAVLYAAEKHLNTWLVNLDPLPDVRLVVLLRDPRDTWVSINSFNQMRGTTALGRDRADTDDAHLRQIIARQGERLRWIADLLEAGEVPVVRYEDLVLDLEGVARTLGESLGIELDPRAVSRDRDMRSRHVSASSPEESIGRWQSEIDPAVAELFSTELRTELRAVGFEP
jgi:glycosyltransferase involved in cell wall biosynthesis